MVAQTPRALSRHLAMAGLALQPGRKLIPKRALLPNRTGLFAAAGLIAALNALATRIGWSLSKGWELSLGETFGVSAIIWLALAIVVALAVSDNIDLPARRRDWGVALVMIALSMLPAPALAAAALVPYGLWGLADDRAGRARRGIASILLALTLTLVWGPLALRIMPELLTADARMVAWMLGGEAHGNIYASLDGQSRFMVAPGCSSLNNMSLATILAVSLTRYFDLRFDRRIVVAIAGASVAIIAINVVRMTMIALHPAQLEYWHHGAGSVMFGWLALFAIVAVVGVTIDRRMRLEAR